MARSNVCSFYFKLYITGYPLFNFTSIMVFRFKVITIKHILYLSMCLRFIVKVIKTTISNWELLY